MIKILTARELHALVIAPGVKPVPLAGPEQYEWIQRKWMAENSINGAVPWRSTAVLTARIDGGNWLVTCECGNAPATDPTWRTACCFHCGAIYAGVEFPEDWEAIERVLRARPNPATRHSTTPVGDGIRIARSVEWLKSENLTHGVAEEAA